MPELPEMEAWRRQLDEPVSAFPIVKAGPAHVATLKTFDPPLSTLEGRRLEGARRRAKRLMFPTEDGGARGARPPDDRRTAEVPARGREGSEGARVPARVPGRRAARPHRSRIEEARGRLAPDARSGGGGARAPRARGARPRRRRPRRDLRGRVAPAALAAPRPARDRGDRPRLGERDLAPRAAVSVRALEDLDRGRSSGSPTRSTSSSSAGSSCASAGRTTRAPTACTTSSTSPATSAAPRSRASTTRSTRSTTAPTVRPAGGSSRTAGSRGYCGEGR